MQPVRLLAQGYGLAAAAAAGWALLGGGWPGALLLFWLGGAAAVLGLAARVARNPAAQGFGRREDEDSAALAEALRRWEADSTADAAKAAGARRSGAA